MACHESHNTTISEADSPTSFSPSLLAEEIANNIPHPSFSISQETLSKLPNDCNTKLLNQLGGIHGIAEALQTNLDSGIHGDKTDLSRRHQAFGSNLYQVTSSSSSSSVLSMKASYFLQLTLDAFKDSMVILLLCYATLSIVLGIKRNGIEEGIIDGAIIFSAILIIVYISLLTKFCRTRRLKRRETLSRKYKNAIKVLRCGRMQKISYSEVVVGDIVSLTIGDQVPADGLFVHGTSFKLDYDHTESSIMKFPFMFTGAKVVDGECRMLVTSVGKNTETGTMMRLLIRREDEEGKESRFQIGVEKVSFCLEKLWLSLSLLVLVVQVLRCFTWEKGCEKNGGGDHDPDPKGVKNIVEEIMNEARIITKGGRVNGLVAGLCVLIFAIRDGVSLGIFIIFAYSARKIMKPHHALVRKHPASANAGLVTTICTGNIGDLKLHHTKLADLWIGLDHNINEFGGVQAVEVVVLDALREAIGVNASGGTYENALRCWAQRVLSMDVLELQQSCTILQREVFHDRTGMLLRRNEGGGEKILGHIIHWKGAPEVVLPMCSHYLNVDGSMGNLDDEKKQVLNEMHCLAESNVQCIAFAYKQVVVQKEGEEPKEEEALKVIEDKGLVLLGIVALKNPYAPEVKQGIEACQESGVSIKLISGDDINTARLIAFISGILNLEEDVEGAVIEASQFRTSSSQTQAKMVEKLRVMANASPCDKLLLVQCLRQKGEVVAVTGTCTRDSPSLNEADLGIALGNESAHKVEESADIVIILDHDHKSNTFTTLFSIVNWGRCVCKNTQKFIQLELTLSISAFLVNLIGSLCSAQVPLEPLQLLWVNLIIDVLGALALALPVQEITSKTLIVRGPSTSNTSIITKSMWRNVVVQVVYQITIFVTMHFKGKSIFFHADHDEEIIGVMIFNTFVLCQVFVLINAREIEKVNVFGGLITMHQSRWFLVVVGAIGILQVGLSEVLTRINHTETDGERVLNLKNWCICFGLAGMSLPIGCAAKWISLPF